MVSEFLLLELDVQIIVKMTALLINLITLIRLTILKKNLDDRNRVKLVFHNLALYCG